jgi:8-amino-7-oxononanoate synthase
MSFLKDSLAGLEAEHLRRELREHDDRPGRHIEIHGERVLNFSSNNYLGLASHPALIAAAGEALKAGTGSTASRLVTGNLALHQQLESELAAFHGLPAARLFNSGYQANLGLISSLAGPEDCIVSDRLNHASVIDGCRLSKARILVADHAQPGSFRAQLQAAESARRRFVVTDSVFSMDGDLAPLAELRQVCDEYGAFLIVDEAHAVGALGPKGAGLCAAAGVTPDALVGGFGKAFGSYGGYVAGSEELGEYLLNRARSFVFSTALPPAVVGASRAALRLALSEEGEGLRRSLGLRIQELSKGLEELGLLAQGAGQSPVFPIIVGDPETTLSWTDRLLAKGVFCQAIRPPTVERGKSRLRIALSALHLPEDIALLLAALAELRAS